jgi:hypothetical protein
MSKDKKISHIIIFIIILVIVFLLELYRNSLHGSIFSFRNVVVVCLFFIIGIPVIYIIKKYLFKR